MNIKKTLGDTKIISLSFPDIHKDLIDVDHIFLDTNKRFSKYLQNMGLSNSFDFSDGVNKKIYTQEFLLTFMELIGNRETSHTPYFYSNSLTKDRFRNSLIKKLKSYFGFLIWEDVQELSEWVQKLEDGDCSVVTGFETFIQSERTHRRLKTIKKRLTKEGLKFMSETYFDDAVNKLNAFR